MPVRAALTAVGALLAPTRCLSCAGRAPAPWCDGCARRARQAATGCPRCADPWPGHTCPFVGTTVVATTARWAYDGPVRDVVVGAKARGAWAGWERLAQELARCLAALPGGHEADAVVPVPGRREVVRRRGIDHAYVLAQVVGARLGVPTVRALAAGPGAGRRVDPSARPNGAADPAAGDWFGPIAPAGRRVLLVDDVLTTGATAVAAARALARAGVVDVHLAVLARSGRGNRQSVLDTGSGTRSDRRSG